jgi:hypothetical protein
MKKSAEQIHKGSKSIDWSINASSTKSINFIFLAEVKERLNNPDPYNRVIHQLRTGHLVALGIEVLFSRD